MAAKHFTSGGYRASLGGAMPVVLITGASSGIGKALAVEMARRGHAVGLLARREELLAGIAEQIHIDGGRAAWARADVLDPEGVHAAVAAIESELGPIDIVVCNAGGGGTNPVTRWSAETARRVMRLNYEGVVNTLDTVLPRFVEQRRGHIAVVSSVAGWRGLAPGGPYSAAKSAVIVLFEALAVELHPRDIAVTTIHPGFVDTPIHGPGGAKHPKPFEISAEQAARIMADGLERKRRNIVFPWQMRLLMTFVRAMPQYLFERLMWRTLPAKMKQ